MKMFLIPSIFLSMHAFADTAAISSAPRRCEDAKSLQEMLKDDLLKTIGSDASAQPGSAEEARYFFDSRVSYPAENPRAPVAFSDAYAIVEYKTLDGANKKIFASFEYDADCKRVAGGADASAVKGKYDFSVPAGGTWTPYPDLVRTKCDAYGFNKLFQTSLHNVRFASGHVVAAEYSDHLTNFEDPSYDQGVMFFNTVADATIAGHPEMIAYVFNRVVVGDTCAVQQIIPGGVGSTLRLK